MKCALLLLTLLLAGCLVEQPDTGAPDAPDTALQVRVACPAWEVDPFTLRDFAEDALQVLKDSSVQAGMNSRFGRRYHCITAPPSLRSEGR